jgi:hypothetical protein
MSMTSASGEADSGHRSQLDQAIPEMALLDARNIDFVISVCRSERHDYFISWYVGCWRFDD